MTAAEEWKRYLDGNVRANRAYDTHMAELEHRATPITERNRAKSKRFYADQTRKKN